MPHMNQERTAPLAPNLDVLRSEIDRIDAVTHPVDHQVFGGRLTPSQLGPFEKIVVKVVKAPMLDDRPWDEISDWAKEIARYLDEDRAGEPAGRIPVAT